MVWRPVVQRVKVERVGPSRTHSPLLPLRRPSTVSPPFLPPWVRCTHAHHTAPHSVLGPRSQRGAWARPPPLPPGAVDSRRAATRSRRLPRRPRTPPSPDRRPTSAGLPVWEPHRLGRRWREGGHGKSCRRRLPSPRALSRTKLTFPPSPPSFPSQNQGCRAARQGQGRAAGAGACESVGKQRAFLFCSRPPSLPRSASARPPAPRSTARTGLRESWEGGGEVVERERAREPSAAHADGESRRRRRLVFRPKTHPPHPSPQPTAQDLQTGALPPARGQGDGRRPQQAVQDVSWFV